MKERLGGQWAGVRWLARCVAVELAVTAVAVSWAAGATITVDRTDDPAVTTAGTGAAACTAAANDCSMRGAVLYANANPGTTIIVPAGTYSLTIDGSSEAGNCGDATVGDLDIAGNNTTISGAGAATTIIQQTTAHDRVICVDQFLAGNFVFTMSGVTITGGKETFGVGGGGMISGSQGDTVTLSNVVFSGNQASGGGSPVGGGVGHSGGSFSCSSCTFQNNSAAGSGGGLYLSANYTGCVGPCAGTFTITNSVFDGNTAAGNGGGLITTQGVAYSVTHSTFTNNTAQSAAGGGGGIYDESGALTATGDTFTGNRATGATAAGNAFGSPDGGGANITATYNRIVGNTGSSTGVHGGSGSTAAVTDNWWGCNGGPGAAGCDTVGGGGTVTFNPWIVLAHAASPSTIRINQSATLTAGFLQDNHGAAIASGNLGALVGLPVTFNNPVLGTIPNPQPEAITAGGTASATYNAGGTGGAGSAQATVDNATVTTNITVLQPPAIAKSFSPATVAPGSPSVLTFGITNPNAVAIDASFTDTLPAGLVVATTPGVTNTCGGTVTAVAGAGSIGFANAALAAGSCAIQVNVQAAVDGSYSNSVTIASTAAGTGNTATAGLTVIAPPSIAKAFGGSSVPLSGTTSLTLTLTNPNTGTTLTGLAFTDNLPAGLVVAPTPALSNTCGGTATATAGASSASLSAASLAAGASCTVALNVQGTTAGVKNNSVQVTSTNGGTGNTATASLTVASPPAITKAFGAATIPLGSSTSLSFTVSNPNTTGTLTGVAFTDTLPAGLLVATPNGLTGTCGGGTIAATQGTGAVSLSGATLAASASCTFSVNVAGTAGGVQNNTTGNVTSTEGGAGNTATASLTVIAPPSIAKAFNPAAIVVNATSTLTFTLTNPNSGTALTGVAFTDTLPTGLTVATASGTACGGAVTTTAPTTIALSGVTIGTGGQCQFSVTVTGATAGQYTNTTGAVTSTEGGTGNTATALLAVGSPDLTVSKTHTGAFRQGEVGAQYTIIASNVGSAGTDGTAVTVTDALPAGLTATAISGTGWTCDVGTVSCTRSDVLAAGSSYPPITLTVTVASNAPTSLTNTVTVSGGGDTSSANDTASDVTAITVPIPLLGGPGLAVLMLLLVAAGVFVLTRRG